MKTSNRPLKLALLLCLTSGAVFAQQPAQPQKRTLLSIFRKKPAAQAPAQPQVQAPQVRQQRPPQTPQLVPQQQQQQVAPAKRGLRLPQFRKPDFSKVRLPRVTIPKVSMPKLTMPRFNMPKVSLPKFMRSTDTQSSARNQGYTDAIRTRDGNGYHAIINAKNVKFYELGPSQAFGPDAYLDPGEHVTLRSNDRAWAHVMLKDGRSGYIGLDQVRFAARSEVQPERMMRPSQTEQNSTALAQSSVAPDLEPLEAYAPPTLPAVTALESPEAQFNPLLDPLNPEPEELPGIAPVDSPEVLFDPAMDPLPSIGQPAPFLADPLLGEVPSIEEELRAIREANGESSGNDAGGADESDADSGESNEES